MSGMKKMIAIGATTLAAAAGVAATAQAQPLNTAYVDSLDWRITNAAREHRISWDQARDLRNQLRSVKPLAWRVETGHANRWEYRRLSNTVRRIELATGRYASNGYPHYSYGYGGWRR